MRQEMKTAAQREERRDSREAAQANSHGLQPVESLRTIKAKSSKWANEEKKLTDRFEWQPGYGAFTVSQSQIQVVQRYIQNQDDHHRRRSFRDEFIDLLEPHGIEFDPQYVFANEHVG